MAASTSAAKKIVKAKATAIGLPALGAVFLPLVLAVVVVLAVTATVITVTDQTDHPPGGFKACAQVANGAVAVIPANQDEIWATFSAGAPSSDRWREPNEATVERMKVALDAFALAGFAGDKLVVIGSLAGRESNYVPTVLNDNPRTKDLSYGLLQINMREDSGGPARAKALGLSSYEELWDPIVNGRAGRLLYDGNPEVPFYAWGPYKDEKPLFGGAELWVPAVIKVATEMGLLAADGSPAIPPGGLGQWASGDSATAQPIVGAGASRCTGGGVGLAFGTGVALQGPDCDGLRGTGGTFNGIPGASLTRADLMESPLGPIQPDAWTAWQALTAAGVAAGFSESYFDGDTGGPGSRPGNYSNHELGRAVDINVLAWTPTRKVAGEPLHVAYAFDEPFYLWLRDNAWQYGWCNPRNVRPLYLNGSATGGKAADGTGTHLEQWHWEFVAGSTEYQSYHAGDLNGPLGVPD